MTAVWIALFMTIVPQAAPQEVTIPAGTEIFASIGRTFDLKKAAPDDPLYVEVSVPVVVDDAIAIPPGSQFIGRIVMGDAKKNRDVGLALDRLILPDGRTYELEADLTSRDRPASEAVDRDVPTSVCSIVDKGTNALFKLFEKKKDPLEKGATITLRLNTDLTLKAPNPAS